MLFEEKQERFRKGEELPFTTLANTEYAAAGIRDARHLTNVMFEKAVRLSSSCIAPPGAIFIGAHSYMGAGGLVRKGTVIGRYCSLGRRISVAGARHRIDAVTTYPALYRSKGRPYTDAEKEILGIVDRGRSSKTLIGHDVWIGDGAVIMTGVSIGTGAIIGANAVVTHDVPPYGIAVGSPAKVIRFRFPEQVAQRLLASQWWELPTELLKARPIGNVFEFLDAIAGEDVTRYSAGHVNYRLPPKGTPVAADDD